VQFGLLGSLLVRTDDGADVAIGGRLPRALLAVLLLAEGRSVSTDYFLETLWDGEPPDGAQASLHSTISRMRRVLEPAGSSRTGWTVLRSEAGSYRLSIEPSSVDIHRFRTLADEGRSLLESGDAAAALRSLAEAEQLWRGPALLEFADRDFARAAAAGLTERRFAVAEDRFDAELRLGRQAAVLGELGRLAEENPLRERLQSLLALALYRAGRQADALAAIDRTRSLLREELGLDPGGALRELETAILHQDAKLDLAVPTGAIPAQSSPVAAVAPPTPRPLRVGQPLIGRDVENARLRALLYEVAAGATRFALVEGDPGIGKTRMLEEAAAQATANGATVVWGRCSEADRAPAYWPWLEVLRGLAPERAASGRLSDALGVEFDATEETANDDPGVRRFALFEAVADRLRAAAGRQPLVVLLEDLHWSDLPSAELLGHLADRLHDVPVAIVGSLRQLDLGRNDAVAAAVSAISRRTGTQRLVLQGLPAAAAAALVHTAVGYDVPGEVVLALHRRSEGNPFCLAEMTRLLSAESGLDDPDAVDQAEVPAGVRDVVRRRLAALPDATRALLETFAVVGREADLAVLVTASGLTADACMDALEPALTSHVLIPVPETPGRHRFAHALTREAALSELSSLRATRLHARVADAVLATAGDTDDTSEIVANHLWAAAPLVGPARAAEALERAAAVALRRTAYENADDLLDRALSLRRSAGGDPANEEAELQTTIALVRLRRAFRGYSRAVDLVPLERPKELARRTGRLDLYQGLLLIEWGATGTSCDIPRTVVLGQQMRELGRGSGDATLKWLGEHAWAVTCWHLGRLAEGARTVLDAAEELEPLPPAAKAHLEAVDSWALFKGFAVHIADLADAIDDTESRYRDLYAETTDPYDQLIIANFAGVTAACRNDPETTKAWADAALRGDAQRRFVFFGAACEMYLGWAVAVTDDPEAGLARLETGLARYLATGTRTALALVLSLRVHAMIAGARPLPIVQETLADAEQRLVDSQELWPLPYLDIARARVAAYGGADPAEVIRHLDAAVEGGRQTSVMPVIRLAEALRNELHTTAGFSV
jgi:DNA-binding SARP family transcriptional activator